MIPIQDAKKAFINPTIIKGVKPEEMAAFQFIPAANLSQTVPMAKVTNIPTVLAIIPLTTVKLVFSKINPIKNAVGINPTMYPPVGPAITANPAEAPLKTGIPIAPINAYKITANVPYLEPNIVAAKPTARVSPVIGTSGNGMVTWARMLIIAANKALKIHIFK